MWTRTSRLTFIGTCASDHVAYGVGTRQIQGPSFLNGVPDAPAEPL